MQARLRNDFRVFPLLILLVGFWLVFPQGLGAQVEQTAAYWLNLAVQTSDPELKIDYYRRALEVNPNDPEAHNNLGVLYKNKGLYDKAIAEYKAAIAIPSYRTPEYAHHNLGVLYKERGEYQKALENFQAATRFNPKFAKAYNGMGLAYKGLGEFEKAAENFKQALKLQPGYIQAEYNLKNVWKLPIEEQADSKQIKELYTKGVALAKQGKYEQAIVALQEALELEPDQADVKQKLEEVQRHQKFEQWYGRALREKAAGKWSKAHEHLEKALQQAGNEGEVKKVTQLQKEMKEALAKEKQELRVVWLYGQGLRNMANKNWLAAISNFTKVLMLDPNHSEAKQKNRQARVGYYYEEALRSINQSKWEEAKEHLQNLMELEPEHAGAKQELAKVQGQLQARQVKYLLEKGKQALNLGEFQRARRLYEEALRLSPEDQTAKDGIKMVEEATQGASKPIASQGSGREEWTKPLLIIAVLLIGLGMYYLVLLVISPSRFLQYYRQLKDNDKSRSLYEKIIEEDPKRAAVYPLLAKTYHELNQPDKIESLLKSCEEYRQDSPKNEIAKWVLCQGEIYQAVHQMGKATQQMEEALALAPNQAKIKEKLTRLYQNILQEQDNPQLATRLTQLQQADPTPPPGAPKQAEEKVSISEEEKKRKEEERLKLLKECFGHDNRDS